MKEPPSITTSPIKHAVLAYNKANRFRMDNRKDTKNFTESDKLCQIIGDRTHIEKDENKFDILHADGAFSCTCDVCKAGLVQGVRQRGLREIPEKLTKCLRIREQSDNYAKYGGFPKSFKWFIEHLMPPAEQEQMIKGCEILFPDTVFFEKGKAKSIVKMDKDYCLQTITKEARLNNQNIFKEFSNTVRERKKDT